MSLLGLLDRTPDLEALYDAPVFPALELRAAEPLTEAETERWNTIVEHLGGLTLQDEEDPPIWREMSAKYASLMLGPGPALGQIWDREDWIQTDFEDTWSMATPIWSSIVAPQPHDLFLDKENAPPLAYRSPTHTHRDKTNLEDSAFERILAGLRRL